MLAVTTDAAAVAYPSGSRLLVDRGRWRRASQTGVDILTERTEGFGACVELVGESEFGFGFEGELGSDVFVGCLG